MDNPFLQVMLAALKLFSRMNGLGGAHGSA